MRFLIFGFLLFGSFQMMGDTVVVYPQPYVYNFYQPDNGPMRGPNSIEGHKSRSWPYYYQYQQPRYNPYVY
jgi:hypothetical protein